MELAATRIPMQRVILFGALLFAFAAGLLWGCEPVAAREEGKFSIVDTGIILDSSVANFAWCDPTHIAVYRQRDGGRRASQLVYFAMDDPTNLLSIDIGNPQRDSPTKTLKVSGLNCLDNQLIFFSSPDVTADMRDQGDRRVSIYLAYVDRPPAILATLREEGTYHGMPVNLKARYVVGNGRLVNNVPPGTVSQSCADYVMPGFRLACMDTLYREIRIAGDAVVLEYFWEDQIQVSYGKDHLKFVRNPSLPPLDEHGMPITHGYFLRDLTNGVIRQIPMQQSDYLIVRLGAGPAEPYLYATCYKAGDHGEQYVTPRGSSERRVCRMDLRALGSEWREVLHLGESDRTVSIQSLDINAEGDAAFKAFEKRATEGGLWLYSAKVNQTFRVTNVASDQFPKVSPDGRAIAFARQDQAGSRLFVARRSK